MLIEHAAMLYHGFMHDGLQVGITRIKGCQKLASHAGFPELADVVGDVMPRFLAIGHRIEEIADPVSHGDEVVGVHQWFSQSLLAKIAETCEAGCSARRSGCA